MPKKGRLLTGKGRRTKAQKNMHPDQAARAAALGQKPAADLTGRSGMKKNLHLIANLTHPAHSSYSITPILNKNARSRCFKHRLTIIEHLL